LWSVVTHLPGGGLPGVAGFEAGEQTRVIEAAVSVCATRRGTRCWAWRAGAEEPHPTTAAQSANSANDRPGSLVEGIASGLELH
jgi:hypothetical protein